MFQKVLVALDGSDQAEKVAEAAREFGTKVGAELRIVHVQEMGWAGRSGQIELEARDDAQKIVDGALADIEAAGVKATGVVRAAQSSRVAAEIVAEATEFGASTIVMGSRGLSGLEGALIGSTTHKLLHLTQLPVLVVR